MDRTGNPIGHQVRLASWCLKILFVFPFRSSKSPDFDILSREIYGIHTICDLRSHGLDMWDYTHALLPNSGAFMGLKAHALALGIVPRRS